MEIELSDYFKSDYRKAYLFDNNKGRRVVELIPKNKNQKKRFIVYAKYLWISENKKEVPEGMQVDHIDNNPRNDTIDNLQILTPKENTQKYYRAFPPNPKIELKCPICGKIFYREYRFRNRVENGRTTCSRKCMGVLFSIRMKGKTPMAKNIKKAVIAINIKTKEKKRYESTLATKIDGFSQQCVSKCCNGKLKTYKGFYWRFE